MTRRMSAPAAREWGSVSKGLRGHRMYGLEIFLSLIRPRWLTPEVHLVLNLVLHEGADVRVLDRSLDVSFAQRIASRR